jgi:hypothetical protein
VLLGNAGLLNYSPTKCRRIVEAIGEPSQVGVLLHCPKRNRFWTSSQLPLAMLRLPESTLLLLPAGSPFQTKPCSHQSIPRPHTRSIHNTPSAASELPSNFSTSINTGNFAQRSSDNMAEVRKSSPVTSQGVASPISDYSTTLSPLPSPSNAPRRDLTVDKHSMLETSPEALAMETAPSDVRQSSQAPASDNTPGAIEGPEHKTPPKVEHGDPPQDLDGRYYCNISPECSSMHFKRKSELK